MTQNMIMSLHESYIPNIPQLHTTVVQKPPNLNPLSGALYACLSNLIRRLVGGWVVVPSTVCRRRFVAVCRRSHHFSVIVLPSSSFRHSFPSFSAVCRRRFVFSSYTTK